jgi:hypothetical protein
MVRVFYEPPPRGPRTNLNRGGYYTESALMPNFLKRWSKASPMFGIAAPVISIICLCYLPLSKYLFPSENVLFLPTTTRRVSDHHELNDPPSFQLVCSERKEPPRHHGTRVSSGSESVHALPQHESHLRSFQQARTCFRPRAVNFLPPYRVWIWRRPCITCVSSRRRRSSSDI